MVAPRAIMRCSIDLSVPGGDGVHAFEGLIEKQNFRTVDHGCRQREFLLHAVGVVGDQFSGLVASCINSSNSAVRLAVVSRSRPYMRPTNFRYSAPVRRPNKAMPSGTTPIWRFTSLVRSAKSSPRISMRPEVGARSPVSILMVVDFPAPLGPRKPKNCPGATRRFTSLTATKSPKRRVRFAVESPEPWWSRGSGQLRIFLHRASNLAYRSSSPKPTDSIKS